MTSSASNNLIEAASRAFDILAGGETAIGVAVSGGSDSTALLVLLADWGRARGVRIEAATVDHGLRAEARGEAEAIARVAGDLGVPHTTLTWRRPDSMRAVAQADARDARHALLATWAGERSLPVLALGHTQDDRIETFLMRARAGSGWRGLSGPLPSGASPAWPEGRGLRLVRPLLAFGREELRGMLRVRNLGWAEDPSNEATRFERVRMRQLARQMEGATLAQAVRVMNGFAQMRAATLADARNALARLEFSETTATASIDVVRSLGVEARLRLLEALVMSAGGGATPPRMDALARVAQRLATQAAGHIGLTLGGAWLRTDGAVLNVSQAPPRQGAEPGPAPVWDRAAGLLADPKPEALAVRGDSPDVREAPDGEKDAGK